MTIYVEANANVPYQHCLSNEIKQKNVLIFPGSETSRDVFYHGANVTFAWVKYYEVDAIKVEEMNGLPKNELDKTLEGIMNNSFKLIEVDSKLPIRFVWVNGEVHSVEEARPKVSKVFAEDYKFAYEISNDCNVLLPGTVVSMWQIHKVVTRFEKTDLQDIQDCFGQGYGSREVSWCAGVNMYLGPKFSHHQLQNHLEGPGEECLYAPYH